MIFKRQNVALSHTGAGQTAKKGQNLTAFPQFFALLYHSFPVLLFFSHFAVFQFLLIVKLYSNFVHHNLMLSVQKMKYALGASV